MVVRAAAGALKCFGSIASRDVIARHLFTKSEGKWEQVLGSRCPPQAEVRWVNRDRDKRFDSLERQVVELRQDLAILREDHGKLRGEMQAGFGAVKASIEARDFRLDEQGRRLTELESRT